MTCDDEPDRVTDRQRVEARAWWAKLRGTVNAQDRAAFEAWRGEETGRAQAYADVERTWQQSAFLAQTPTGRARSLGRISPFQRFSALQYGIAASLVLAVFGVSGVLLDTYRRPSSSTAADLTLTGQNGRVRLFELNDGSRLKMDDTARLRVTYSATRRDFWLDAGRARFDVAHEANRPFVVHAGGGSVTARGTLFEVAVTPVGVAVVLLRGVIEVRKDGRIDAPRVLRPGQQTIISPKAGVAPAEVAPRTLPRWSKPMVNFDATPLSVAVASFNLRNPRRIELADRVLGTLMITGGFDPTDPATFATAVATAFDLTIDSAPGTLTLSARARKK